MNMATGLIATSLSMNFITSDRINSKQLRIAIDSALSGKNPGRWLCQWM
jgi:hypothetical protein